MKKIVVLALALIIAGGMTAFSQTQTSSQKKDAPKPAPTAVKQEPAKTNTTTMAKQTTGKEEMTMIPMNQMPKDAQNYITKMAPGKKVDKTMKMTDAKGTVTYLAEIGTMVMHFDSTGKFLKETKKEENSASNVKQSTTPVKTQTAADKNKTTPAPAKK